MTRFDFDYPPFDSLSHTERQQLAQGADIVYFAPAAPIIDPGQVIDSLDVVNRRPAPIGKKTQPSAKQNSQNTALPSSPCFGLQLCQNHMVYPQLLPYQKQQRLPAMAQPHGK